MTKIMMNLPLDTLSQEPESFLNLYREGKLELETFNAAGPSLALQHTQDEVYVIAAGTAEFICGMDRDYVKPGDVLFVAAGVKHQFANCSAGFSTWAFYEPELAEDMFLEAAA